MKKISALRIILFLLLLTTGVLFNSCNSTKKVLKKGINSNNKSKENVITIGAVLPLTGRIGFVGTWEKEAFDLFLSEINSNGEKIKIIYADSKNEAKEGLNAFEQLTSKKVDMYISALSDVTLPLIPEINKLKKDLYVTSVAFPNIAKKSKYLFRYCITSDKEATLTAEYLKSIDVKKVNLFYINDEYGVGAQQVFEKKFKENNGEIVFKTSFQKGSTDFKDIILKSHKNDYYYIIGYGGAYVDVIKQISQLIEDPKIVTCYTMDIPEFRKPLIGTGLKMVYTAPKIENIDKLNNFVAKFKKRYHKEPNLIHIYCYDLMNIIFNKEFTHKKEIFSVLGYKIESNADGEFLIPLEIRKIEM